MAEYTIQKDDIDLLRKAGVPEDDIAHKYGKNDKTLVRYLNYHQEIQNLFIH